MKRVMTAIILILGLLLVSSPVSAAGVTVVDRTGDGQWVGDTWEVDIYPGESKSTALSLHNSSSSHLDVEVTVTPDSLDGGNLTFGLDESDFTMAGRSDIGVTLTVNASGSATPGTYATELEIRSEVPSYRPSGGGGFGGGITRYLRVDFWGEVLKTRVTSHGEVKDDLVAVSIDEVVTLYVAEGVLAQNEEEKRLKRIVVLPMEVSPPSPKNGYIVGTVYDFTPVGATFDPFIKLEIRYDRSQLPKGVAVRDLVIAYYDEEDGKWRGLKSTTDVADNTVTAKMTHLTPFAIIGYEVEVTPVPAPTPTPTPTPTPAPVPPTIPEPTPTPTPPFVPPPAPVQMELWEQILLIVAGLAVVSGVAGGLGYWLWRRGKKARQKLSSVADDKWIGGLK